jgi:branched-chain amino acid transport system permease protein
MHTLVQEVVNGIMTGSTYGVVALGFGLVFSVMRVLNMAHPDLAMIGAYVAYMVSSAVGDAKLGGLSLPVELLVFIGLAVAGATVAGAGGLVIERLIVRTTRGAYLLVPFIATLGVSIFLENGANSIWGSNPVPVASVLGNSAIRVQGITFTSNQLATLLTSLGMLLALSYYVRRTKWGLATRAVAELPGVASANGINVNRVSQLSVGIASAMAGTAGVTLALLQTSASPFMGQLLGLKCFVCMMVAGNRHIEGILAVGLALGVLESLVVGYISADWVNAVAFTMLLAILAFRPSGLFGSYST